MSKKNVSKVTVKKEKHSASVFKKYFHELLILLLAVGLYANSIPNDYNMDDELVTKNHRLTSQGVKAIPEIFTSFYYQDAMGYAYDYRPIVHASFALEHQLFGDIPQVSHFFNLLLYIICCLLLYRVLKEVSDKFTPFFSLVVVLLFTAHSAHTEVVSSIKNRDEILGLIFCLVAFSLVLKAVSKQKIYLLLFAAVAFGGALMSKITFLPFAFIIILALSLFTNAGIKTTLTASFLFTIPAVLLIQLNSMYSKILFFAVLPSFTLLLHVVTGFLFRQWHLKTFAERLKKQLGQLWQSDNVLAEERVFSTVSVQDLWKHLMPSKNYFTLFPIILTLILGGIYAVGNYEGNVVLVLVSLSALLIISIKGSGKLAWWANLVLFIAIGSFVAPPSQSYLISVFRLNIVVFVLAGSIFFKPNKFVFASIILAFLYSGTAFFYYQPLSDTPDERICDLLGVVFTVLALWAALEFLFKQQPGMLKVVWVAGLVIKLGGLIAEYYGLVSTTLEMDCFLVGGLVFFGFYGVKKWPHILNWLLAGGKAALILILLYQLPFSTNLIHPQEKLLVAQNALEDFGKKNNNLSVLPGKSDRPISIVEQPLANEVRLKERAGMSLQVMLHYFTKTILPYPLSFYYGYKVFKPAKLTDAIPLVSLVLHLLLLLTGIAFIKKNKAVSFSLFIYFVTILPFSNLFISVPGVAADRFLLVPSIGWCILLAQLLFLLWKQNSQAPVSDFSNAPKAFKYVFGALLCFYSVITIARNFNWKDDLTLFRHDIEYVNNSAQAHNLLALHLMQHSEKEPGAAEQTALKQEALLHFKKTLEIYPPFFNVAYDIGRVYTSLNMPDSAIIAFKHSLTIDTSFIDAHLNLAGLYFSQGKLNDAIPYYEHLINVLPTEADSYNKLSFIYYQLKQYDQSITVNKRGIRLVPNFIDGYLNIGRTYISMNMSDSATYFLNQAIQINPDNQTARQLLQSISK